MSPARPMKATTGTLPTGPGWAYELKWDGMRATIEIAGGQVRIWSANGREATPAFPELAALGPAFAHLDVVLDGEIVALDRTGDPSFERLQHRMHVVSPTDAAPTANRSRSPPISSATPWPPACSTSGCLSTSSSRCSATSAPTPSPPTPSSAMPRCARVRALPERPHQHPRRDRHLRRHIAYRRSRMAQAPHLQALQTLPNGECGRPIQQACPHPNACLTCDDFLTDRRHLPAHHDQLARTRKLIATAEADGNFRMAEMNRQVETNLTRIIETITSRQVPDVDHAAS